MNHAAPALICWWVVCGIMSVGVDKKSCKHKFKYYGVVGLVVPGHTVGTIDLWRCVHCGSVDANPRRVGDTKPPSTVGFNILDDDERWMVLACYDNKPPFNWELIRARPGLKIEHECAGPEKRFVINQDYSLQLEGGGKPERHDLKMVEDYMEKNILLIK